MSKETNVKFVFVTEISSYKSSEKNDVVEQCVVVNRNHHVEMSLVSKTANDVDSSPFETPERWRRSKKKLEFHFSSIHDVQSNLTSSYFILLSYFSSSKTYICVRSKD